MRWNMSFTVTYETGLTDEIVRIQTTARAVAAVDAFASLALVAERNHYVRPKINEKGPLISRMEDIRL